MDKLLTLDFWKTQGAFVIDNAGTIVPLLALAWFAGWIMKSIIGAAEINGLRASRDVLEQRLEFLNEKSAHVTPLVSELQSELAVLKARISDVERKNPGQLPGAYAAAETSIKTTGNIAAFIEEVRQTLAQYHASKRA